LAAEPSLVAAGEERDGAWWRRSGARDCCREEERRTVADMVEKSGGARWLRWRGTAALGGCGGEQDDERRMS
jgi:hypothetical protein